MEWGGQLVDRCSSNACWSTQAERYLDPAWSDFKGHTQLLLAGQLDLAWVSFGRTWLGPFTIGLALGLAYAGCLLVKPINTPGPTATAGSSTTRQRSLRNPAERATSTERTESPSPSSQQSAPNGGGAAGPLRRVVRLHARAVRRLAR
jgi:hypothetical protein